MRIAAIYIQDHEYLFDKPQIINFGGQYFYNFIAKNEETLIISRNLNENFIKDFFDLTRVDSKVTNINAIVGQNGAGKSTLLDIIRSQFIEYENALPTSQLIILVESDESELPLILVNYTDFEHVYFENNNHKTSRMSLSSELPKKPQTIYYSPHYDYKFNPYFEEIDNHDISFERIVEKDLAILSERESIENGETYSPSQELLLKNSLRQIAFLSSNLVAREKIFRDIFYLPEHYEPILHFRVYKEFTNEWNTPRELRDILKSIKEKLGKEIDNWHLIRKFKDGRVSNQVEINQYILKRNVIKSIIAIIYKQMEKDGSFLEAGNFPYEEFENELSESDALNTFILFIKHSTLTYEPIRNKAIFTETILDLLHKIYEAIDKTADENSVTNYTLKTSKEDAIEILQLQRDFLTVFNKYYHLFNSVDNETIISDLDKVEEFINYMPFSRRLSSGENSLLNLFSRIYDFLHSNLKSTKFRELKDHYILLLDEADLTFHPSWKKRYVKALLKTLPHFFNELENKPSIQIIFTTHDPLTLSDLPNANVIYIERRDYDSNANILDYNNPNRPLKTFGANISDLIADSFFIEHSLIGDFAFDKIKESIKWLNNKDNKEKSDYHKKLICLIDEPIVQRKLAEMYDEKMEANFQIAIVNEQIQKLEELRNKLQS